MPGIGEGDYAGLGEERGRGCRVEMTIQLSRLYQSAGSLSIVRCVIHVIELVVDRMAVESFRLMVEAVVHVWACRVVQDANLGRSPASDTL